MEYLSGWDRAAYHRAVSHRRFQMLAMRAFECSAKIFHVMLLALLNLLRGAAWLNQAVRISVRCLIALFFSTLGLVFFLRLVFALGQVLLFPIWNN